MRLADNRTLTLASTFEYVMTSMNGKRSVPCCRAMRCSSPIINARSMPINNDCVLCESLSLSSDERDQLRTC